MGTTDVITTIVKPDGGCMDGSTSRLIVARCRHRFRQQPLESGGEPWSTHAHPEPTASINRDDPPVSIDDNEHGIRRDHQPILEKTKVPVYNYLFAWEYPINGGITSFHCAELAFCFHALSVPQIKTATGGGAVALALQDKVSQAWINFAKTGNPNQPGLEWKPYTKDDPQAMVFDTASQSVALRDDKLVSLLPPPAAPGAPTGRGSGRGGR